MAQIIAVDIDDVLAAGAEGFIAFSNQRWGTNLTIEDYSENFANAWGVPLEEALVRVQDYLQSGTHGEFRHYNEALPVLQHLKDRFDLIVVTSRRVILKPETDEWLERHFPGIFTSVVYAGIWDNHAPGEVYARLERTKAELLRELKADYLIDDQPKHCWGAAAAGIESLLFGDYKWNRTITDLPVGVTRVRTWAEVGEYFSAKG